MEEVWGFVVFLFSVVFILTQFCLGKFKTAYLFSNGRLGNMEPLQMQFRGLEAGRAHTNHLYNARSPLFGSSWPTLEVRSVDPIQTDQILEQRNVHLPPVSISTDPIEARGVYCTALAL